MTTSQRESIAALRAENYPYSFIGKTLGLSPNTVKSVCRRKNYEAHGRRKNKAEKQNPSLCKCCFRPLGDKGRKDRLFCSESCRMAWWRNNRRIIEK